jgi:hypothetical protein
LGKQVWRQPYPELLSIEGIFGVTLHDYVPAVTYNVYNRIESKYRQMGVDNGNRPIVHRVLPFWLEAQTGMYVVTCFRGDEMIRPLEDYWLTTGMNEHPFMGFLVTAGESVDLFYRLGCLVPVAFAMVFASLLSVDKIAGITGVVTMAASLLIEIAGFQYGIIAYNLCWIVLAAVMLWRMQTINK